MLTVKNIEVMNFHNAIRGARNPMNSWARSDSYYDENGKFVRYADSYVSSKNAIIRLIVSCGIGFHTLPLRLFNPGELIFITIDTKK